jgi:hypothetical protein
MARLRIVRTALLVADVAAHLAAFRQARAAGAPMRDQVGMLLGAAMYKVLAIGVLTGKEQADRQALVAPIGGVAALLATWKQSGVPATTRATIIGIDVALVATGVAARRTPTVETVELV